MPPSSTWPSMRAISPANTHRYPAVTRWSRLALRTTVAISVRSWAQTLERHLDTRAGEASEQRCLRGLDDFRRVCGSGGHGGAPKDVNLAVRTVIARGDAHLSVAHAADAVRDTRGGVFRDLGERDIQQNRKLRPKLGTQLKVLFTHATRADLRAHRFRNDLLQRDQVAVRDPPSRRVSFRAVGEIFHAVHDPDRHWTLAHRAQVSRGLGLFGRHARVAVAVAVVVILAFFGKELDRVQELLRILLAEDPHQLD